jgi:hypothetical protein
MRTSSTVNKHSNGGSFTFSGLSNSASAVATPAKARNPSFARFKTKHEAMHVNHRVPYEFTISCTAVLMEGPFFHSPMPLSEPSVVPVALTQSPSTRGLMGSFMKSCTVPAFFSHTMSTCPCNSRHKSAESSAYGAYGTLKSTVPANVRWCRLASQATLHFALLTPLSIPFRHTHGTDVHHLHNDNRGVLATATARAADHQVASAVLLVF